MTAFAIAALLMLAVAVAAVAGPLLRGGRALLTLGVAGFITTVSVLTYLQVSNYRFDAPAVATPPPDPAVADAQAEARAAADVLAQRVAEVPDDRRAWLELGRARLILSEYDDAIFALRRAGTLDASPEPERMVMLGEALTFRDGQRIPEEAATLFTEAVALAPRNPKALWYASLAYAQAGENPRAADMLERLIQTGPPPEIADALRERIVALRGGRPPAPVNAGASAGAATVAVEVSIGDSLAPTFSPQARLFVAVRDADNGGPPLAAVQRDPSELPLAIEISDADAMIRGRGISTAETLEIVARVSMSGDPLGGAGDYVGRLRVPTAEPGPHRLVIDSVQN